MRLRHVVLAAAVLPHFVHAEEAPTELEPLVVTATRTAVRESDTLASITVITRADIERAQANDAAELLRFAAGVEVARAGGPGQFAAAFIRGGNSQHTLVLLDGARLNPTTQGAALQNINPDLIERIEIVRGPRSTLYGSEAMGGVINIITRRPAGERGSLQARAASYETRELVARGSTGGPEAGAQLHLSRLDARGFAPHTDSTAQRAHRNITLDLRGDAQLGALRLDAGLWSAQGSSEYVEDANPFCFPCAYTSPAALDFRNRALSVGAQGAPLDGLDSRVSVEHTLDDLEVVEGTFSGSRTRNARNAARWQNDWRAAPWTRLSLGLETARERTRAGGVTESRAVHTVSLADELQAGAHRALVAASFADHDAFGSVALWNAEYGYTLAAGTRLSLGAGTGFRAPNVIERFFPGFGNPDLGPERARSYEAGVRQQFGSALRAELRAFRTDYDDLIGFDPDTFLAGNVARARNEGVELGARWQAAPGLALRASATAQDPRACDPDCDSGPRLVRRAKRLAALQAVADWGPAELSLDVLGVGPRTDFDSGTFAPATLPGYALLSVGAGAPLGADWSVQARVENVLDQDYQTVEGYRQPARSASVTLRWAVN